MIVPSRRPIACPPSAQTARPGIVGSCSIIAGNRVCTDTPANGYRLRLRYALRLRRAGFGAPIAAAAPWSRRPSRRPAPLSAAPVSVRARRRGGSPRPAPLRRGALPRPAPLSRRCPYPYAAAPVRPYPPRPVKGHSIVPSALPMPSAQRADRAAGDRRAAARSSPETASARRRRPYRKLSTRVPRSIRGRRGQVRRRFFAMRYASRLPIAQGNERPQNSLPCRTDETPAGRVLEQGHRSGRVSSPQRPNAAFRVLGARRQGGAFRWAHVRARRSPRGGRHETGGVQRGPFDRVAFGVLRQCARRRRFREVAQPGLAAVRAGVRVQGGVDGDRTHAGAVPVRARAVRRSAAGVSQSAARRPCRHGDAREGR